MANRKPPGESRAGPGRRNVSHEAVFRLEQPVTLVPGEELEIVLSQQHGGYNNNDNHAQNLGRFRISVTRDTTPPTRILPPAIQAALAVPEAKRSAAQKNQLFSYWRGTVPEFASANDRIEALWHNHPEGYSQLVLQELAQGRRTHRLDRGDFLNPKEVIEPAVPGVPQSLAEGPAAQSSWLGPLDGLSRCADHGSQFGQSRVAKLLRHRIDRDQR